MCLLLGVAQGAGIGDVFVSTGKMHHDRRIPLPGFDKMVRAALLGGGACMLVEGLHDMVSRTQDTASSHARSSLRQPAVMQHAWVLWAGLQQHGLRGT